MNSFFAIALTLFFVIDALGNIPIYLSIIRKIDQKKIKRIAIRELLLALVIMIIFHYLGQVLLSLLSISKSTVQVAGGLILFLIAIRLIFSHEEESPKYVSADPFIVPIATPLIAGPSVLSVIMIYALEQPQDLIVIGAIFVAWFISSLILFFASPIYKLVGEKVLAACQRLMGLIVAVIAVQMFIQGIKGIILEGTQ